MRAELGRYPSYITALIRCVSYWLKLINRMDVNRLPFKAYKMLCNLDERGKMNWVSNVRHFLSAHGFMYVWNTQSVGSIGAFISVKAKAY